MTNVPRQPEPDDDDWNMEAAREKLRPKIDQSKRGRQKRQKQIMQSVAKEARGDGRSLRATGRTAQFNFKAMPDLKPAAQKAATEVGLTLAEWMEDAVNAKLGRSRIDA